MTQKSRSKFVVTPQIVEGKLQIHCQNTGSRSMTRLVLAYNNRAFQASKEMTLKPGESDTLDARHLFGFIVIQVSMPNRPSTIRTLETITVPQVYEFSVSEIVHSTLGYLAILITNHTGVDADGVDAEFRLEGAVPPMGSRYPYLEANRVTFLDFLERDEGPVSVWIGGKKIADRVIQRTDFSVFGYFGREQQYKVVVRRTGPDMAVPGYLAVAARPDNRKIGAPYESVHLAKESEAVFTVPDVFPGKHIVVTFNGEMIAAFMVEPQKDLIL